MHLRNWRRFAAEEGRVRKRGVNIEEKAWWSNVLKRKSPRREAKFTLISLFSPDCRRIFNIVCCSAGKSERTATGIGKKRSRTFYCRGRRTVRKGKKLCWQRKTADSQSFSIKFRADLGRVRWSELLRSGCNILALAKKLLVVWGYVELGSQQLICNPKPLYLF